MSASSKVSERIARLDQLLSQPSPPILRGTAVDLRHAVLVGVPLERIRALTTELQERCGATPDDVDALTMRMLLNDYRAAVAQLRAVTNDVDSRLLALGEVLHRTRKVVHREEEMAMKRAKAAKPSGE